MSCRKSSQMRSDTKLLQQQSLKMEEKLQALKITMAKEKKKREMKNGNFWQSSQKDAVRPQKESNSPLKQTKRANETTRTVKVRVLTESNIDQEVKQALSKPKDTITSDRSKKQVDTGSQLANTRISNCGQCEEVPAILACVECQELYCKSCFSAFHQKGALARHQVRKVAEVPTASPPRGGVTQLDQDEKSDGVLLEGSFNEEESAAYFREALLAWRAGQDSTITDQPKKQVQKKDTSVSVTSSTSTQPSTDALESAISAPRSSLSYMERMLIYKHRTDPYFYRRSAPVFGRSEPSNDFEITSTKPSQYNLFHAENTSNITLQPSEDYKDLPERRAPSTVEVQELFGSNTTQAGVTNTQSEAPREQYRVADQHASSSKDLAARKAVKDSICLAWNECKQSQCTDLTAMNGFFLAGVTEEDGKPTKEEATLNNCIQSSGILSASHGRLWHPDQSMEDQLFPEDSGENVAVIDLEDGDDSSDEDEEFLRPESVLAVAEEQNGDHDREELNLADLEALDNLAHELASRNIMID